MPLMVLAALLLSMKLCDANCVHRRQVHQLAFAVGFAGGQLLQKERQMVQVVRGRIWSSTPWTFLSTCAIDDELRAVAESVMVLSLGSASVNRYASSQIAAGALCVGNLVLGRKAWSEAEEDQTWYSELQLEGCVGDLLALLPNVTSGVV
uniref:Cyclin C-terminal domain-containing protein n=1 Tax=Noctiluca scintillans TaxID=2966 RepID=A0A7S1A6I2_NOCSC